MNHQDLAMFDDTTGDDSLPSEIERITATTSDNDLSDPGADSGRNQDREERARQERLMNNLVGNMQQLQRDSQLQREAFERTLERIASGSAVNQPQDIGVEISAEEEALVRAGIRKDPEFLALQKTVQRLQAAENDTRQAEVQRYKDHWVGRMEQLATDVGDSFTQTDYDRMCRFINTGLAQDAAEFEQTIRNRAASNGTQRAKDRRALSANSRGVVTPKVAERLVAHNPQRSTQERWKIAQAIATSKQRTR